MFYQLYELNHAALQPARAFADAMRSLYSNPLNPFSGTLIGRSVAATAELFERTTRHYGKPEFGIHETKVDWESVDVAERVVWSRPFCNLLRFERDLPAQRRPDPKLLMVAPMSGHYATLLRGTVETMLPHADVYITDWVDARMVPAGEGSFDLDDYIDYIIEMLHFLGPDAHVMAVCQPSVPVLAAVAVMEQRGDPFAPASMTLMGGPIDTRRSPTAVNVLAEEKGLDWFRDNVVMDVPWPAPGFGRKVYPGFLQLSGFMSMNLDRHIIAHKDFFMHLVKNDGDSAEKHRDFYDEYLAVMDLTAEFYLQTVDAVFISHALPKGELMHRGELVDPGAIRNVALFTVEGENDDISGLGQTQAAHDLCVSLPAAKRAHYMQPRVGHYGVFNGSRFRSEIAPRIVDFIASNRSKQGAASRPRLVRSDVS
ncbi:polyhydroxyalkanoate depolymerase [Aquamicrobium defluvii]|uniref:Esterase n=1 Tax=Aquamicrobium defluvii TaxID=69279 RepID=A0A011UK61_9HYPH|nr:polyhydroxyalkanoate depolymerase [Aquamicrobium defluvii]EXL06586.1 esterase [Aquamicrobium defluvii]EZQ14409.1 esterase [Halopseudomonas bauzanensis]TDR36790.1 poly(3-hydroxybutyrate) depolymerase [Aquamicrobium defluvii]